MKLPAHTWLPCLVALALWHSPRSGHADPAVEFTTTPNEVQIAVNGAPVATYVYRDTEISRPYFAHLDAPGGVRVSRNHPPIAGRDVADHPTFHPGLWMAFGDISGSDYWRLAARVEHVEFLQEPNTDSGYGHFAVRNRYLAQHDPTHVLCEETARYTLHVCPFGYLLTWDSTFSGDREFSFGDQEEMGLGVRVATPIRVEQGNREEDPRIVAGNGTIVDAAGRQNGDEVWGQAADWCDFSGTRAGRRVGVTIFCHPKNFRPSWFHARDYGLLLANPFGRAAFGKGKPSKITVQPNEKLRLRYGVLLHANPPQQSLDIDAAYAEYLRISQ